MKVKKIIVCTHGEFGTELLRSAKMIIGPLDHVAAFSLMPGMAPEDFSKQVEEEIRAVDGKVLCLVDLLGGTPMNALASLRAKYDMIIVTGVNLPMLMEAHENLGEMEAEELAQHALDQLIASGRLLQAATQ